MKVGFSAVALLVTLAFSFGARAEEIVVNSSIDTVTVYPSGAEVSRVAKSKLSAGSHTLIFRDLPATALARSIRVEGKATGRLDIGSVDTRVVAVPGADPQVLETNRRRLEEEIEKLSDERASYQSEIEVAESQKRYAQNLVKLPLTASAPVAGQHAGREDWQRLSALIVAEVAAAEKAIHAARIRIRTTDRRIDELKKKLASEAPKIERRVEVKVAVNARSALEADLVVRYQVRNASWRAHYDARLMTGSRTAAPSLTIVRRGTIAQTSGEDWKDVKLSLSTTRPTAGTSAPSPRPVLVDYERERPALVARPRSALEGYSVRDEASKLGAAPQPARPAPVAEAEAKQDAVVTTAQVETSAFQAIFNVPDRVTVPATGDAKRVTIGDEKIEPQLEVHAAPRFDQRAFLYVKLAVPKSAPYLAGPVALFRDSTFVGNGRLPQLTAGEEHDLGFGIDDAVRVRLSTVKETRGESGLISSSATSERSDRIVIKNLHERPVAFTVVDHVPVALNEEIRVDTTFRPAPAKRNLDDKRGVHAWQGTLTPGAEQTIEVGYKVSWPSNKKIEFRR
ncbi:MAG: hypothetical protein RLZ98_2411 [Pseudomonadota bacterium]